MEKAEEVLEKEIDKGIGFFNYVFNFDDENKACILNMFQYVVIAIIPIVLLLKLIKEYVPEEDDAKGSVEITLEILIQIGVIFMGIWFINKIVRYIPTYSKVSYYKFNETNFAIPLLIILVTMQTKLGAKINILAERVTELWNGKMGGGGAAQSQKSGGKVRVRQPLAQSHQASRGDTLDSTLIPPPAQTMGGGVDRSTTLINNLPNLNNSGQDPNSRYGSDVMNLALMDGDNEPMAANGLLGGAFGSGF